MVLPETERAKPIARESARQRKTESDERENQERRAQKPRAMSAKTKSGERNAKLRTRPRQRNFRFNQPLALVQRTLAAQRQLRASQKTHFLEER